MAQPLLVDSRFARPLSWHDVTQLLELLDRVPPVRGTFDWLHNRRRLLIRTDRRDGLMT